MLQSVDENREKDRRQKLGFFTRKPVEMNDPMLHSSWLGGSSAAAPQQHCRDGNKPPAEHRGCMGLEL